MLVRDILQRHKISLSFEFFPPKAEEDWDRLFAAISEILPLAPAYVSVTYGAGGSTRDRTHRLAVRIRNETMLPVVAHLTCVNHTWEEVRSILEQYQQSGIENILALRGDLPRGQKEWLRLENGFSFATELVAFIKKHFPAMGVGVAGFPEGHPETRNRLKEMDFLKAKVDAGADYVVTQLFFDNRDFYDFRERCLLSGIQVPVVAGIMPITSRQAMGRISEMAAGARFPARLLKAVARAADDELVGNVGIHWATEQVRDLIDNEVRGIHFYTMNRSRETLNIFEALGIRDSARLAVNQVRHHGG